MGPANALTPRKSVAGGGGFEPPLRGPEPRVLPLDDPPPTHKRGASLPQWHGVRRGSAQRDPETPTRAEARHLGRRNLDLLAGARVAAVARRAPRDDERAKSGDGHAPAAAERLDDAGDHGVHGLLRSGLGAAGVLRHDRDEIRLEHPILLTAWGGRCQ